MANQTNNLLILEHSGGAPTGVTRTIGSIDDIVLSNFSSWTFSSTGVKPVFADGLSVGSGKEVLGSGALTVRSTGGDLLLDTATSGDVVIDPAGDAVVKLAGTTSNDFFRVEDTNAAAVFAISGDGSGVAGKSGATFTFAGSLTITEDLTVNGTTTTVNSTTLTVDDNLIVANSGPGSSRDAGYLIQRYQPTGTTSSGDVIGDPAAETGTAQAGATTSITLAAGASATDGYYVGWYIQTTGGTGSGQVKRITAYNGTTKVATVDAAWDVVPDATTTYALYNRPYMGVFYDESADEWVFGATPSDPGASAVTISDYIKAHVGGLAVDDAATFAAGLTNTAGEVLISGGNLQLNDNVVLSLGTGDDLSLRHDGSDSVIVSATGNLIIDNQAATGATIAMLGTDTADTAFMVQNNSASALFSVNGAGAVSVPGALDVNGAATFDQVSIDTTDGAFSVSGPNSMSVSAAAAFSGGIQSSSGEVLVSGGNVHLNDNIPLALGSSSNAYLMWSSAGNAAVLDNQSTTAKTIMILGTDTSATAFEVQNNSQLMLFQVDGSGQATFAGNVNANSGLDVSGAALTVSGQPIQFSGNIAAAPGDGFVLHLDGAGTWTDNSTASSGTAALAAIARFEGGTLAAANTGVTTSRAATVYIDGAPTAGANQTITNAYALLVDSGAVQFDGSLNVDGALSTGTSLTLATGVTVTGIADEDDMVSDSASLLATQQSIKAYVDFQTANQNLNFQVDADPAQSINLATETMTFTSGDGINLTGSGNDVTVAFATSAAPLSWDLDSPGAVTIDGGSITIGGDPDANTCSFGTGAAAKTVIVGSTDSTSSLTLQSGSGAMTFTAGGAFDVNASGAVTVDGASFSLDATSASNISVTGGDLIVSTITSGALHLDAVDSLNINSSAGVINIGDDAVSQNINVGTGGTRTITVGSGSATLNLVSGGGALSVSSVGGASTWTVADNDASALKFSATGQDLVTLDSTDSAEKVVANAFLHWSGGAGLVLNSGAAVSANHAVVIDSSGRVVHADADTDAGSRVLGWALDSAGAADVAVRVATDGKLVMEFAGTPLDTATPSNDISKPVYLHGTAGKVSLDVPISSGASIVRVGWLQAINSTTQGVVVVDKRFIGKVA